MGIWTYLLEVLVYQSLQKEFGHVTLRSPNNSGKKKVQCIDIRMPKFDVQNEKH